MSLILGTGMPRSNGAAANARNSRLRIRRKQYQIAMEEFNVAGLSAIEYAQCRISAGKLKRPLARHYYPLAVENIELLAYGNIHDGIRCLKNWLVSGQPFPQIRILCNSQGRIQLPQAIDNERRARVNEFSAISSCWRRERRFGAEEMPVGDYARIKLAVEIMASDGQLGIRENIRTITPYQKRVAGSGELIDLRGNSPAIAVESRIGPGIRRARD